MKKHFREQFDYNDWANNKILISLQQAGIKKGRIINIYSHILTAQVIWLLRIRGLPTSPFPIWEEYKINELESMSEESSTNWKNYLDEHEMETFEEMIHYSNTQDRTYESTIREIIIHVLNHSTYHRGQIAMMLREMNIEPPVTDFIAYQRLK